MRRLREICRISLILSTLLIVVATARAQTPISGGADRTIQPQYPAPAWPDAAHATTELPPLQLLGVRMQQAGIECVDATPALDGKQDLTVTTYWMPSIRLEASAPFSIEFWDHLNLISQEYLFRAGPESGRPAWEVGSVYQKDCVIPMNEVSSRFSGDGYLLIRPKRPVNAQQPAVPSQLLRVSVQPLARDFSLSPQALASAFPNFARAVGVLIRMGKGSECAYEAPADWVEPVRRLGVVSSLSYRNVAQNNTVCTILVNEGTPNARTLRVVSGKMTSRCDYDLRKPAELDHERAAIFDSRDSATLDAEGRPTLLHTYYGILDLGEPAVPVKTLKFICDADTVFDVFGIVALAK